MRAGFPNLVFWCAVILVALSSAWGQAPAQVPAQAPKPQMTPSQALQVIGNIQPHFEGSIEQINEQRELQFQAFQVLKALVVAQGQYVTAPEKPEAKKKSGK